MRSIVLAMLLIMAVAEVASAASAPYLRVQGAEQGAISPDPTSPGYINFGHSHWQAQIRLTEFHTQVTVPVDEVAGRPSGVARLGGIWVTKAVDHASVKLLRAMVSGEALEITVYMSEVDSTGKTALTHSLRGRECVVVQQQTFVPQIVDAENKAKGNMEVVEFICNTLTSTNERYGQEASVCNSYSRC